MEPMSSITHLGERETVRGFSRAARATTFVETNAFVILVLGACVAFQATLLRQSVTPDSWLALLSGRVVAHDGLPHHDVLAVLSHGRTWVDQQWLAQLGLYGTWTAGGWTSAVLAGLVLFATAFAVLAASARQRGASPRSVAFVLFACYLTALPSRGLRAQLAAYPLFALVLALVLADERRPSRLIYLTLPLLVLWANLHGSVLLGAGLVALHGLMLLLRRRSPGRRAATLLVAPWLCVLVSPYALELPGYYRSILANGELARASSEWARSTLHGQPLFFGLLVLAVVLAALGRRGLKPLGLVTLGAFGLLGLLAVRNVVWFALAAAAVLPAALDEVWPAGASHGRRALNLILAGAGAAFAVVLIAVVLERDHATLGGTLPPAAARAAAVAAHADPRAMVFANESYADWLVLEQPSLAGRIAFDLRYELLRAGQLERIVAFRHERGPGWQDVVQPYRLLVLGTSDDAGALRVLEKRPGAKVLWKNPEITVLHQAGAS
jgi:hypothetical protein